MRQIYIVNATQCVISDAHPEGMFSTMPDYPKTFDSRNYPAADGNPNGDTSKALNAAKAEYFSRLGALYVGSPSRVMATVTLEAADGKQIMRGHIGAFPDMTPEPEQEQEEQNV